MENTVLYAIFWTFVAGWIATISGVILGGFLVYRTKRESHEPLVGLNPLTGDSFNLEDEFTQDDLKVPPVNPLTKEAHDRFVSQFSERIAEQAAKDHR